MGILVIASVTENAVRVLRFRQANMDMMQQMARQQVVLPY